MSGRPIIPFVSHIDAHSRAGWHQHLQDALPDFEVLALQGSGEPLEADVAIVANPRPEALAKLHGLKWVQSLWAGVETLVDTLPDDIAIVRMVDPQLSKTMAEAVLTATLFLHRDFPHYAKQQAAAKWRPRIPVLPEDRTVGVLGLGELGRAACEALVQNGFEVLGWGRSAQSIPSVRCLVGEDGLQSLLQQADIVVVLLPSTPATVRLLDGTRLGTMKKGASIINFARGNIINTESLIQLLDAGQLSHAVLDVFETEPLPADDPFWTMENVTILPHISAPTNMKTASAIAARNVMAYLETGALPQSVDRKRGY